MAEAIAKRTTAITKGCATVRPILVAVEAEAQRAANNVPVSSQLICFDEENDIDKNNLTFVLRI